MPALIVIVGHIGTFKSIRSSIEINKFIVFWTLKFRVWRAVFHKDTARVGTTGGWEIAFAGLHAGRNTLKGERTFSKKTRSRSIRGCGRRVIFVVAASEKGECHGCASNRQ
jgi:hypothetical protein